MKKLLVIGSALSAALLSLPAMAVEVIEVPEPGSLTLLALGMAGVLATRLRRK